MGMMRYQDDSSSSDQQMAYLINLLTHLPLDKMEAISLTIFSDTYSWMKSFVFWLKFHCSLVQLAALV